MNTLTNFYNRFAIFYSLVDIFLKPQKKRFFNEINLLPNGNLLEIGVGNGSHFSFYKNHKITGIEISSAMLQGAKKKSGDSITLFQMDGENLAFEPASFDYVVLSHVIAVAHDPEKLFQQCYKVLKPGGKLLILNHFTPNNWLKYLDKTFNLCARLFQLKSLFYITDIRSVELYQAEKEIALKPLSYFKILIFAKP